MRASRGQIKIQDCLRAGGFDFTEQYSFPDLVSQTGRELRFDFCVFDDQGDIDFLIQYQGIQHYQPKSKFGGWEGLRKQQFRDMKKRQYCKQHGYNLVIIPYTDERRIDYDYIVKKAYGD